MLLGDCNKTKSLIFLSTGNIVQFHVKKITTLPDQFISLKTTPLQIVTSYGNIFQCDQNVSISFSLVCDGNKDCNGEEPSDELNCPSSNGSASCPTWYYLHGMECLLPFTLRPQHITKPLMKTPSQNCSAHKLLSSREGCFDFTDICIFEHHGYNIIPCKRGEHIQSCKQFQFQFHGITHVMEIGTAQMVLMSQKQTCVITTGCVMVPLSVREPIYVFIWLIHAMVNLIVLLEMMNCFAHYPGTCVPLVAHVYYLQLSATT